MTNAAFLRLLAKMIEEDIPVTQKDIKRIKEIANLIESGKPVNITNV